MSTVSSTVASVASLTTNIALSSVGLAVAHRDTNDNDTSDCEDIPVRTRTGMTTATFAATYHLDTTLPHARNPLSTPFAYSPAQPRRLASENTHHARSRAASTTKLAQKRYSLTPSTSGFGSGMERSRRADERNGEGRGTPTPAAAFDRHSGGLTPNTTWLRRLSSSLSTSRDSSRTPSSRPGSAAVSYTNGSYAISQSGSTTPIWPDNTQLQLPALPPNKLVKRSSSLHSANGSTPGSGSRIPVFRRPLTSHQRSTPLKDGLSGSDSNIDFPNAPGAPQSRNAQWRPYFTPRIAPEQIHPAKRRRSTSIPNPVRRVYPDRRYTPTLVSTKDVVHRADVELDDSLSEYELDANPKMAASSASSPFPSQVAHFEAAASPRRSFSIGDLLSTGPHPLWRRPSTSKGRPWSSKSLRKSRPRVVSEPQVSMGINASRLTGLDVERPAKRRGLTDPATSRRSVYSSSSSIPPYEIDLNLGIEDSGLDYTYDQSRISEPPSRSATPDHYRLPLPIASASASNTTRISGAHSEVTSTVGSDSEYRSAGDNSTDYQSESYYDSFPTRTTRSSSGRRGPHIETIFDESPPTFSSGRSTKLRDFLSDGHEHNGRYSTIEEEESVLTTPVRSVRNRSVTSTPSARHGVSHNFTSSPPVLGIMPDPDDIDWDAEEDDVKDNRGLGIQQHSSVPSFNSATYSSGAPFRFGPALRPAYAQSANTTPLRNGYSSMEKASLFDWAEPQPSPSHPNRSPPRPRTVHGKKDQDSRGSRPVGRRPVSGMHARSHSVPVVPDLDGKRNNVVANKFGTWGVGSKGVTEDWNEDFDFDEPQLMVQHLEQDEKRIDSGHEMFVPRSIREQQQNVVANIGLLREWGLLIEELKELRVRAVALEMLSGPYARAWQEVDAMIELADQETEEQTLEPRRTPPSSPGFDMSAFEDATPSKGSARSRQSSVHQPGQDNSLAGSPAVARTNLGTQSTPAVTRPRKDSELVAQSVIAALQTKRSATDPAAAQSAYLTNRKVPFDTATLRHIVPYVNSLKRKVKDALRETEGLSSPHRKRPHPPPAEGSPHGNEPAFRSIFNSPQDDDVTTLRQSRREQAATDNDESDSSLAQSDGLANRMQRMTFT
ncbi:uncharacterized protein MYCFIDRAFT_213190 [Pseudocercospora fijiensis CIRAD86]|uniref:Uncharacterized protein n=1 Tax=Pseudocercospora fijiensis (strain CIRAD86) TaxID=383855 RepID=N1Q6R0_PSEFD|nr:uncharacterized protein MYCFIDRAFT_213190 [Pseudocercospora fijiensis CIRAD86]EME88199.1 hypothetical protein MYCFIDRAFT_213190 [Pseudocercospora fijiensis CIRAD86]